MDVLDSYSYFDVNDDAPYMRLSRHGLTFSRGVTQQLGAPQKVIFLTHEDNGTCAVRGVDVADPRGVDYADREDLTKETIVWRNARLADEIASMGNLDLDKHSYILPGYPLPDEDAVMFDTHTARADDRKAQP